MSLVSTRHWWNRRYFLDPTDTSGTSHDAFTTLTHTVAGYPLWLWGALCVVGFWCLVWLFWIWAMRQRRKPATDEAASRRSRAPARMPTTLEIPREATSLRR